MGLAQRDYMRADGPGYRPGLSLTWKLILVNAGLWFLFAGSLSWGGQGGLFGFLWTQMLLHPDAVFAQGKVWQLFTAFWFHDPNGLGHVFFNMLLLFFFGRHVETMLGPRRFLSLYLRAGLASTLAMAVLGMAQGSNVPALGASGAVYGVCVWLALTRPHMQITYFIITMPLWVFVGVLMVGNEVVQLTVLGRTGAVVGHLAGAAYGWALHQWPGALARSWLPERLFRGPKRSPRPSSPSERPPEPLGPSSETRAAVEALLDKIQREGIQSLSEAEKDFLQEASRRYGR